MASIGNIIKKFAKITRKVATFPLEVGLGGWKSLAEISRVRKEVQIKKLRCLYVRGNRLLDQPIECKGDLYLIDPFKERLFFKTNTLLDKNNRETIIVTDGHPVSLDVSKMKMEYVVEESKVVKVEDAEKEQKKLTYTRAVYYPLDMHKQDTLDGKMFGNLSKKVIASRAFDALDPIPRQELMMALIFGLLLGMFLAMTVAYWLAPVGV